MVIKLINHNKKRYKFLKFFSNSIITTILGLFSGLLLNLVKEKSIQLVVKEAFEPIFMTILLPPIMFSSALNVKKAIFFKNFDCILLFSIFGTFISIFSNGVFLFIFSKSGLFFEIPFKECLIYSSMISATDPVSILSMFKS